MRTRIKICGIKDPDAAFAAADAGADAVGFIFVPGSPRFIEPDEAAGIMLALPPLLHAVAVVRDLSVDEFCELEQMCPTTLTQLHGRETEDTVRACGPGVIKAFSYDDATIASQLARWGSVEEVDAVLIDSGQGGTGHALPWDELARHLDHARDAGFDKPVFLAGGLTPDNVAGAVRLVRPYAVDVSSGVESAPGAKDQAKIAAFCAAVRDADREQRD
jgi:phosphoribosylanthranilate isomerase